MTRLLIDAHALLWWLGDDEALSGRARDLIERAEEPLVGVGTVAEIAVKRSIGKLSIDDDWPERAQSDGIALLGVAWSHIVHLQELPFVRIDGRVHRDPFDRLLVAQASSERIPIVTRDPAVAAYGVPVFW